MKVALAAPYFHPHIGGVESHVLALARELVGKGHQVKVFTFKHARDIGDTDVLDGVEVRRLPGRVVFQTPMTPRLVAELRKEHWDIIHAHSPPPLTAYYAAKASVRARVPFIFTHHCDPELPSAPGRLVTWVYDRSLFSYTLRHASRIIVYTESYAATSLAIWKYPTVCIPTGLDLAAYGPHNDGAGVLRRHNIEGKKVVLFVGRMTEHKGLQTLIEAAPLLPKYAVFLLVGPGHFPRPWVRQMKELGVRDRFYLVGKVPEAELPAYYAACDLLVLPSVSRLEAFGLVLVEAMASGKPVVASDIPGVRDVLKDGRTGLLAEPFNHHDLAEKIMTIISNGELARRMGLWGRRHAEENYSWKVIGNIIEKIYKEVVEGRQGVQDKGKIKPGH